MKKIMVFMFLLASTIFLMSCEEEVKVIETLNLSKIEVRLKNENAYEFYEGNELDISNFEATFFHRDGDVEEVEDLEKYDLIYEYNSTPEFDHTDSDDNIFKQDVVFKLGEVKSEPIRIITKRKEVKEVSLISYGNSDYEYGESLDLEGYKLLVNYDGFANEIVNLDYFMFADNVSALRPEELGLNSYEVFYNGKQTNSDISLFITAASQTLDENLIEVISFTKDKIEVNKIENALYAFHSKKEPLNEMDLEFTENNIHEGEFLDDYLVFVKLKENKYYKESNIVELTIEFIPEFKKPELLDVKETTVKFKYQSGFNLVLLNDQNKIIKDAEITIDEDKEFYLVSNLIPNLEYKFAFVTEGLEIIHEENIYGKVKTKEALNIISFDEEEYYEYDSNIIDFIYDVEDKYASLIEVNIKYYQNNIEVRPYLAGKYDVSITNNLNNETINTTMTIAKRSLVAKVLNSTKVYGNNDPVYQVILENAVDNLYKFKFNYFRESGENVNTYQVGVDVINDNYEVTVISGTLNITKRNVNINIDDQTSEYGKLINDLTYEVSEARFKDELEVELFKEEGLVVGNYPITATYNDSNFIVTAKKANYEITKKTLTVKALNQYVIYGDDVNNHLFEVEGLVYDDNIDVVKGNLSFVDYDLTAGEYLISGDQLTTVNYKIDFKEGTLAVAKKLVDVSFKEAKKYAGQDNEKIIFDVEVKGLVYNDSILSLKFENELRLTIKTDAKIDSPKGTYNIEIAEGYISDNYKFNYQGGKLTVDFVKLWITIDEENLTSVFNKDVKEINIEDIKITEALNKRVLEYEEYKDIVNVTYSKEMINAGKYNLTVNFLGNGMYKSQNENFIYTIEKRLIDLSLDDIEQVYDDSEKELTYQIDQNEHKTELNISLIRDDGNNVGSYDIFLESYNQDNYDIKIVKKAKYEIVRRTIYIETFDVSQIYGDDESDLTYKLSEEYDSELSLKLNRELGNDVGKYSITLGYYKKDNLILIHENSSHYQITKREIIITIDDKDKVYNHEDPVFTITRGDNLVNNDVFETDLSRVSGEDVNESGYTITGTITNDNYQITTITGNLFITPTDAVVKGTNDTDELIIVETDYERARTLYSLDGFKILDSLQTMNIYESYNYVYELNGEEVSQIELLKGGTTVIVTVTGTPKNNNVNDFSVDIVYKFKSVELNGKLYTIEDAILIAETNQDILVVSDTIFSDLETASIVYNYDFNDGYNLYGNLIISYYENEEYINKHIDSTKSSKNTVRIDPQTTLVVTTDIMIVANSNSKILVNASRDWLVTNTYGSVIGDSYGLLILEGFSKENKREQLLLLSNSLFENYSFSIGDGIIRAERNSKTIEYLVIFGYPGGTNVGLIQEGVLPFNQFAPLSINNKIIFEPSSIYEVFTSVLAGGKPKSGYGSMFGNSKNNLIEFNGNIGTVTKSIEKGRVNFSVSNAKITITGEMTIAVDQIQMVLTGKDLPLGGLYDFSIVNNSIVDIKASVMFISGSSLTIDNTSQVIVHKKLYIDTLDELQNYNETFGIFYSRITYNRKITTFYDEDFAPNPLETAYLDIEGDSKLNIYNQPKLQVLKDANMGGYINREIIDKITVDGDNSEFTVKTHHSRAKIFSLKSILSDNKNYYSKENLESRFNDEGSSPFIKVEDEDGDLHFEHQPLPFKLIKSVEGTSYGTLKLLQDQDGIYYIQIIEEGNSTTMLQNFELYAVDYFDDGTVLDFFYDIVGNPHTIREKLRPVTFKDQNGFDYLDKVINKDGITAKSESDNLISYFEAVFKRNNNSEYAKLMFSTKVSSNPHELFTKLFKSINGKQNMWWLDQALMNDPIAKLAVEKIFKSLMLQVQVWNGQSWITQGYVEVTPYLMEEYLIYINLDGITSDEVKVRFSYASMADYEFDSVFIDYTDNLEMTEHKLDLVSAILNGETDVIDKLLNSNEYIALNYKDGIRFGFAMPELKEGYSRGFGVKTTGYVYSDEAKTSDELLDQMENKTFEKIKQIILDSGREELIIDIPKVENFYNAILYMGSQERLEDLLMIMFDLLSNL